MDKVIYLDKPEYEKLWLSLCGNGRFEIPAIDPQLRNITVQNQSGPGLPFANEYERMMYEYFNPDIPSSIRMFEHDGITTYYKK